MGVKVKGIREAQARLERMVGDIKGRKAVRAIYRALLLIGTESATMVPVATSTLLNSQFRDVVVNGTRLTGRVGYSAAYAVYVHNAPGKYLGARKLRSVRKGERKGSMGYIWDKTGEPKFLDKAVEKTKRQVDEAIRQEMQL